MLPTTTANPSKTNRLLNFFFTLHVAGIRTFSNAVAGINPPSASAHAGINTNPANRIRKGLGFILFIYSAAPSSYQAFCGFAVDDASSASEKMSCHG